MFWHGPPLSRIERLCMSSFVAHGHAVQLHVYEEPKRVPAGVTIRDATAVLPREQLFVHRASGSLAVFADWFRYSLLAEHGGLWVDTDMVCLRPFDHAGPEIFGWQDQSTINNAVLGLPQNHALARWMVECCVHPNRALPYDSFRMRRRKLALLSDSLPELAHRIRRHAARPRQSPRRQLRVAPVERDDAPASPLRSQRTVSRRLAVRAALGALRHQR